MRTIILSLFSLLVFITSSLSQNVVSVEHKGSKSKNEISNMFGLPFIQTGVDYYKMTYTSVDAKNQLDTLSGLLVIPVDSTATYPVLVYEHGTSDCKTCVPSRYGQPGGNEGEAGLLFSGMGYVALLPDYVGMGDGRGFQTYVHAATSASATEDMLKAFRAWAPANNVLINDQLFVTGYSQGGYASMAFHKYMQETYNDSAVTAATHNSGPYSLSGVMRDLILVDSAYSYPAYIPNTILGMNEVYGMLTDLNTFFKAPYVPDIQKYYDGNIGLTTLNARLIDSLIAHNGSAAANNMIEDSVLLQIENNPNYIINQILRDNDVYHWMPKSPTLILYCKADDQVPYRNSIVAIDTMYALGADPNLVQATDLNSNYNHAACVNPAFTQTILFFSTYQSTNLGTKTLSKTTFHTYPNPANDKINFKGDVAGKISVSLWSINGKQLINNKVIEPKEGLDVSHFESGTYILRIESSSGDMSHQKIVINR